MKEISSEVANSIISRLLSENRISQTELDQMMQESPSEYMKAHVDIIHTLLCNDNICFWDEEKDNDNSWTYPHHAYWLQKVINFMEEEDIIEAQLGHALADMSDLIQHYERVIEGGGAALFNMWRESNND